MLARASRIVRAISIVNNLPPLFAVQTEYMHSQKYASFKQPDYCNTLVLKFQVLIDTFLLFISVFFNYFCTQLPVARQFR